MSQNREKTLPDIFPPVSFDINHGKYVDEIDVDLEELTAQLRAGGLSDEEILNLPIRFRTKKLDWLNRAVGMYTPKRTSFPKREENIALGGPHLLKLLQESSSKSTDKEVNDMNEYASEAYSDTLAHEAGHAVAARDTKQRAENEAYEKENLIDTLKSVPYNQIAIASLAAPLAAGAYMSTGGDRMGQPSAAFFIGAGAASVAFAGLDKVLRRKEREEDRYMNHPEEVRARAAGASAPKDLVKVKLKRLQLNKQ